ncbi:MAG: Gfo/Idh/MocA family protein [Candidatus Cyclobacteriaceae bacterium M2_1C_046]
MSNNIDILVIGAGTIASEYVKVIEAIGHTAIVVGRGENNVNKIKESYPNIKAYSGGIRNWLNNPKPPKYAIVATPIDFLAEATHLLLDSGCKYILVEKPLTYSEDEAKLLVQKAAENNAFVHVAFNRRSYISVEKAKELILKDGSVSSFHFNFSEAVFRIDPENYSKETTRFWGIANSSHVIDTAFYLGGEPAWLESKQYGKAVGWHKAGSVFTGIGETKNGIPFSYHSDWGAPGKWNIEIMTNKRRLLFSPMEVLHQQLSGGFAVDLVDEDYSLDQNYKPGFYKQVEKWLHQREELFQLKDLPKEITLLNSIFGY